MIVDFNDHDASVDAMFKSIRSWNWSQPKDMNCYEWDDIREGIPSEKITERVFFSVGEHDDFD